MRTRDALKRFKEAGLDVEPGTSHIKIRRGSKLIGVISQVPRRGEHDPKAINKIIKKGTQR